MKMGMPGPRDGVAKASRKGKAIQKTVIAAAVVCLFFAPGVHEIEAAINLNFIPDDGSYVSDETYYSCSMSYIAASGCSLGFGPLAGAHLDGTAIYQRIFSSGGINYYHVIIGDYTKGGQARNEMALEYIVEASSGYVYNGTSSFNSGRASASYGDNSSQANRTFNMENPYKGDDLRTGIGSGNPTRVIMNQILYNADGTVNTQFLKGIQGGTVNFNQATGQMTITGGSTVFDSKPIITQFANTAGEMYNQFTIDMRHKNHADNTQMSDAEANGPNGKITNITNLIGGAGAAKPAADQGDYDTTDATFTPHYTNNSNPNYTAGTYTYTAGSGTAPYYLGGGGTYNYDIAATAFVESGFVPMGKNFTLFCEPSINPDWQTSTANTIGGPKACSNGGVPGGGGSRGW